jgi:RimJ/RimL family protein N-acetyltransferase
MQLIPYTHDDRWLTEALETDPRVMAELGGPRSKDQIPEIHRRRLAHIARGGWHLKIIPEPGGPVVGAISIWHSEWRGEPVTEAGWMILPKHQGRGYASAALAVALDRARAAGTWGDIHAFPGEANGPSNALCRKFGFELLPEVEVVDYGDRILRCHHWVLRAG